MDDIRDEAKAKGTGKWTSQIAMDLELPINVIDTAVAMRDLSKYKSLRTQLSSLYQQDIEPETENVNEFLVHLEAALYFATIIAYAQGMHLLTKTSEVYHYDLKLDEIAKIWRGGCIIRSRFLNIIYDAFQKDNHLEHLLLNEQVQELIRDILPGTRIVLSMVADKGLGSPAFAAALSYFDTIGCAHLPANLIQAQRDFFGAHTYELIGKEGTFHTAWEKK